MQHFFHQRDNLPRVLPLDPPMYPLKRIQELGAKQDSSSDPDSKPAHAWAEQMDHEILFQT